MTNSYFKRNVSPCFGCKKPPLIWIPYRVLFTFLGRHLRKKKIHAFAMRISRWRWKRKNVETFCHRKLILILDLFYRYNFLRYWDRSQFNYETYEESLQNLRQRQGSTCILSGNTSRYLTHSSTIDSLPAKKITNTLKLRSYRITYS